MRNSRPWLLAIVFISIGGMIFGAGGLAIGGVATGLFVNSRRRGFLIGGSIAAFFWLFAAAGKMMGGESPQLLALAGSLANLPGAQAWSLLIVSGLIAFVAGGLGGWLGGSLRQMAGVGVYSRKN